MKNFYTIILLSLILLNCKGQSNEKKNAQNDPATTISSDFEAVHLINKDYFEGINIFQYSDKNITIKFPGSELLSAIGIQQGEKFIEYEFDFQFDSGSSIELHRFVHENENLYIAELRDYYARFYSIIYEQDQLVYYFPEIYTDLSAIIEDNPKLEISFKITKNNSKEFTFYQFIDGKEILSKQYTIEKPMKVYKSFDNIKSIKDINKVIREEFIKNNISTPEKVINAIFKKGENGDLEIDTYILDYISKNTTRENNTYLLALENFITKNKYSYDEKWGTSNFSLIKAYIFNTTYPLRKKYWSDRFEEWYNGKPEELLGTGSIWRDNNYYGLPDLEKYEDDFRSTYWSDSEL